MSIRYSLCMHCGRCPTREEQHKAKVDANECPTCGGQVLIAYARKYMNVPNKKNVFKSGRGS